jgi:hypothetical protein
MTEAQVAHVAEIFNTPLTGAYNWDYRVADDRINKLYELGKQLNWNASLDVHWDQSPDWHQAPPVDPARARERIDASPWKGYAPWDAMRTTCFNYAPRSCVVAVAVACVNKVRCSSPHNSFLCAPSFNAKMYAASQTLDTAQMSRFQSLPAKTVGPSYPVNRSQDIRPDKILTDERWDLVPLHADHSRKSGTRRVSYGGRTTPKIRC